MSSARSKVFVLDTWAMLAIWTGNPPPNKSGRFFGEPARNKSRLFSLINYGECLYIIEREQGLQNAQRAAGIIDQLAVHVAAADRPLVFEAANVKAHHSVSYADAFSIALAKRSGGAVMTGDPEFKLVESEVAVHWLV